MLSALVAPRMGRWLQAAQQRSAVAAVQQQLEALPAKVYLRGEGVQWRSTDAKDVPPPIEMPEGWTLRVEPAMTIDANGMTSDARLELRNADGELLVRWRWIAPSGRLHPSPDDGA